MGSRVLGAFIGLLLLALVGCGGGGGETAGESQTRDDAADTSTGGSLRNGIVEGQLLVTANLAFDADTPTEVAAGLVNQASGSLLPATGFSQPLYGNDFSLLGALSATPYAGQSEPDLLDAFETGELPAGHYLHLHDVVATDASVFLGLFERDSGVIVDWILGETGAASLRIPQSGHYLVGVYMDGGGSVQYRLSASALARDDVSQASLHSEFVSGVAVLGATSGLQASAGNGATFPTRMRLDLAPSAVSPLLPLRAALATPELREKWDTLLQIGALARRGQGSVSVDALLRLPETDLQAAAASVPNDPYLNGSGSLSAAFIASHTLLRAPEAWQHSHGDDVIIAVIDSRFMRDHEDLEMQYTADGYDFVGDDTDPFLSNDAISADTANSLMHGTAVASVAAASANNALGGAGVAYAARIMPLSVCDGSCSLLATSNAILYAAGLPNSSGRLPARRADIINLSLSGENNPSYLINAVAEARAVGVMVAAAAGNGGWDQGPRYPAATAGVIGVAATTSDGRVTVYSNRGSFIDIAAPGGGYPIPYNTDTEVNQSEGGVSSQPALDYRAIAIALPYDSRVSDPAQVKYGLGSGTSFATPNIAGVLALYLAYTRSIGEDLTPDALDAALASGKLTREGRIRDEETDSDYVVADNVRDERFGFGILDASAGIEHFADLFNQVLLQPLAVLERSEWPMGHQLDQGTLRILNAGQGELRLSGVSSSASWLGAQISDSAGAVEFSIVRSLLPVGDHSATLDISSNGGVVRANITASRSATLGSGSLGTIQVMLIEPSSGAQTHITLDQDSAYRFRFSDLPYNENLLLLAYKSGLDEAAFAAGCRGQSACWELGSIAARSPFAGSLPVTTYPLSRWSLPLE